MSRGPFAVALSIAVLCGCPAPSRAQFGVSGGVTLPQSDFSTIAKSGYTLNALVPVALPTPAVSLRFEAGLSEMKYKGDIDAKAHLLSLTGNAVFSLPAVKGPYAIAGVGVYRSSAACSGCTTKATKGGVNGGIGYTFALGTKRAFLEARIHYIGGPNDPTNGGVPDANTRFMPLLFGLVF